MPTKTEEKKRFHVVGTISISHEISVFVEATDVKEAERLASRNIADLDWFYEDGEGSCNLDDLVNLGRVDFDGEAEEALQEEAAQ